MERRKEQAEPGSERPSTPARRGRQRLSVIRKITYTLDELPVLLEQLRHQEPSPEEIARRTRVVERIERRRAKLPKIDVTVDELIRRAREEMAGG